MVLWREPSVSPQGVLKWNSSSRKAEVQENKEGEIKIMLNRFPRAEALQEGSETFGFI